MSDAGVAELIALGTIALLGVGLFLIRRDVAVATDSVTYTAADGVSHTQFAFLSRIEPIGLQQRLLLGDAVAIGFQAFDAARIVPPFFRQRVGTVEHPPPHGFFFPAMKIHDIGQHFGGLVIMPSELCCECLPGKCLRRQLPLFHRRRLFRRGSDALCSGRLSEPLRELGS